jgi:hypothetical protein
MTLLKTLTKIKKNAIDIDWDRLNSCVDLYNQGSCLPEAKTMVQNILIEGGTYERAAFEIVAAELTEKRPDYKYIFGNSDMHDHKKNQTISTFSRLF